METIVITCKNDGCDRTFRVPEYVRHNSTIKTKLVQECLICKNKTLLGKSTLYDKKTPGANKYTVKSKSGKKSTKTPRERFYSSTAWKWFSRYVLLYYSVNGQVCKCSTCGTFKSINDKEMHTGHWIKVFDASTSNYATAFEFTNLGPQCSKCNNYMGGRERLMAEWLKEQHGQEELDRLQVLSKQIFKLDDGALKDIAHEYRLKFHGVINYRGWSDPWRK